MLVHLAALDVGHGDCVVIYDEDRSSVVVVDCGDGDTLLDFLEAEGIGRVHLALASHNDADHIRGLIPLVSALPVDRLAVHPHLLDPHSKVRRLVRELLRPLRDEQVSYAYRGNGALGAVLAGLSFQAELLYPTARQAGMVDTANAASAVMRVEANGTACLLTGDLDRQGWEQLLATPGMPDRVRAQVLKFPHHGGRLVSAQDRANNARILSGEYARSLLQRIAPALTIISTGERSGWQHPDPDVMLALREYGDGRDHYIACTEVTRLCDPNFRAKRVEAYAALQPTQRSARVRGGAGHPCAGNIAVVLAPGGLLIAHGRESHQANVQLYERARCVAGPSESA